MVRWKKKKEKKVEVKRVRGQSNPASRVPLYNPTSLLQIGRVDGNLGEHAFMLPNLPSPGIIYRGRVMCKTGI